MSTSHTAASPVCTTKLTIRSAKSLVRQFKPLDTKTLNVAGTDKLRRQPNVIRDAAIVCFQQDLPRV